MYDKFGGKRNFFQDSCVWSHSASSNTVISDWVHTFTLSKFYPSSSTRGRFAAADYVSINLHYPATSLCKTPFNQPMKSLPMSVADLRSYNINFGDFTHTLFVLQAMSRMRKVIILGYICLQTGAGNSLCSRMTL